MAGVPPTAPPEISPDGNFYWDGTRWVPMHQPQPYTAPAARVALVSRSNGRRNGCIGVALLIALFAAIGFCGNHSPSSVAKNPGNRETPSPSAATGPAVKHTVLTFSGTGYETTQPFNIPASEWVLSWTIAGDPKYAEANFYVYSSDGSSVDSVGGKPGHDSATIHAGDDIFFIEVLVANATYKVIVTADYPGPDQIYAVPTLSKLATFKGSGDKSTATFHVSGSIWQIVVQTSTTSQYTSVSAYVMKAGSNDDVEEASVEGAQKGSRTVSYVYSGPGAYYIKVLSANTSWTVTVEQSSS
jgi:hypothetical protein